MIRKRNEQGYVIRVAENALIQLVQNGLEAYSVKHHRRGPRIRLETYGLLWGHETTLPDGRTFYAIEMVNVDTSAEMEPDACLPSDEALGLKRDLMTSFWPQFDFLGDFHTHPYDSIAEVNEIRGWCFSEVDQDHITDHAPFWRRHGYRVGLVLTIARMGRASGRDHQWLDTSTIEFTLGNYRMWLKAYVVAEAGGQLVVSADADPYVLLDCPALVGLNGEYTRFGRVPAGRATQHRPGQIG